jgi:pyridoxamine 5'-phosphate oxidase
VAGAVTPLSREATEQYFRTRPRGSRIAAWASDQSSMIADRAALESRWREIEKQFHGQDVPLPPFWAGFLLKPDRIEFWQGRPSRLHDRFCYVRGGENDWKLDRLAP